MSNYPDDINNYNNDPRSPLYDSSFDYHLEGIKSELFDQLLGSLDSDRGRSINKVLRNYGIIFDYVDWLLTEAADDDSDDMDNAISKIAFGDALGESSGYIVDALISHLSEEILSYAKKDPEE